MVRTSSLGHQPLRFPSEYYPVFAVGPPQGSTCTSNCGAADPAQTTVATGASDFLGLLLLAPGVSFAHRPPTAAAGRRRPPPLEEGRCEVDLQAERPAGQHPLVVRPREPAGIIRGD